MASAWECSRNDVFEGFAVLLAAAGVWLFAAGWPDLVIAAALLVMFLRSAWRVFRTAWRSYKTGERSEEHTSELQSLMRISYAVFCLKKKKKLIQIITNKLTIQQHVPKFNTSTTSYFNETPDQKAHK